MLEIPASAPGSFYQSLPKISVPALKHRQIAGIVEHPRKPLQPQLHLLPVDVSYAQPLGAAVQLAGVLGGDNDAVRHHPDFYRHTRRKARLRNPLPLKRQIVMPYPVIKLGAGKGVRRFSCAGF